MLDAWIDLLSSIPWARQSQAAGLALFPIPSRSAMAQHTPTAEEGCGSDEKEKINLISF